MKGKKGVIYLYIIFIITAILILIIGAVVAPMGTLFTTEMYSMGERMLIDSNETIQDISNVQVRDQIETNIAQALSLQETNIEINTDIFKYSWIPMLLLTFLILFLYTRRVVEVQGGGFI